MLDEVSVEDPDRPRRLRNAVAVSAAASLLFGGVAFVGSLMPTMTGPAGKPEEALFACCNTIAVSFWILLGIQYLLSVRWSPARIDWERRLRLAEKLMKRPRE